MQMEMQAEVEESTEKGIVYWSYFSSKGIAV
jgi:hypothetical protein